MRKLEPVEQPLLTISLYLYKHQIHVYKEKLVDRLHTFKFSLFDWISYKFEVYRKDAI